MGRRQVPLFDRHECMSPPPAVPPAPPIIAADTVAREEWDRVTALLLCEGVVAELDRATLALYCTAYARWIFASERLTETGGPVIQNAQGDPQQNPWLDVLNQAARAVQQAGAPLGLSPAARSKVKVAGERLPAATALDDFLNEQLRDE